jgi:hypothetical protein
VVQKLLSITGPITLSDGTVLNGSNATKVLQHDLYWKYCSAQAANPDGGTISDALFAEAANLAFSKLLSNLNADSLMDLASVFAECTDDREIMLWLDDAEDQQLLEEAGFAGALSDDSTQPELGVFFDLIVGSKLGWYVDINTDLGEPEEQADGSLVYQVTTTVTNTVDPSEVEAGGTYIMGADYDLGNMQPILYLFGPAGGSITNFTSSVGDASLTAEYEGLDVIRLDQPELRPGQSITMKYTVTTAAGTEEPLKILSMPTLSEYR